LLKKLSQPIIVQKKSLGRGEMKRLERLKDLAQLLHTLSSFLSYYFPCRPTNSPNQTTLSTFSSQNSTRTFCLRVRETISNQQLNLMWILVLKYVFFFKVIMQHGPYFDMVIFLSFCFCICEYPFGFFVSLLALLLLTEFLMTRCRFLKRLS